MKHSVERLLRLVALSILALLGLALVLVFLGAVLISLPPGERYVKGIVERQLEGFLGQEVRIGRFETNLLTRAQVGSVRIWRERPGAADIPLLNLGRATVRYTLLDLVRRRFVVRSVGIDSLFFNVVIDAAGNSNLPELGGEPKEEAAAPGPVQFLLRQVSFRNSTVHYGDRTVPLDTMLRDVRGQLVNRGGNGYDFQVEADSLRFAYKDGLLDGSALTGRGNWNAGRLLVDDVAVRLPGAALTGDSLLYATGPDSLLAGRFRLTGESERVVNFVRGAFAPGIPPISGTVELRADLAGTPGNIRVGYILSSPDLRISDFVLTEAYLRGAWRDAAVVTDSLSLRTLGGAVYAHGVLHTRDMALENVLVRYEKLSAQRIAEMMGNRRSPYRGVISGRLRADGPANDLDRLRAAVTFEVDDPSWRTRRIPDIVGSAGISGGRANARVISGGSEVLALADIDGRKLNGSFSADIAELADFTPLLGIPDLSGILFARGVVSGTVSRPDVRTTVTGKSIEYAGFPVNDVQGGVTYRNGIVVLSDVRANGSLDSLSALRPPLHVDSLFGSLRYTAAVDGPLDDLRGELRADTEDLEFRGIRFDTGSIRALVRPDTVHLEQAVLENDSLRIDVEGLFDYTNPAGSVTLDLLRKANGESPSAGGRFAADFDLGREGGAIAASVRGERIDLRLVQSFVPAASGVQGMLFFTGDVSGNPKNPSANMRFSLLRPGWKSAYLDSLGGEAAFREGVATVDSLRLYREDFYAVAGARLGLTGPPGSFAVTGKSPLQAAVRGDSLRLSWFEELVPGVQDLTGLASFDITVGGTVGNPDPGGNMTILGFSLNPGGGAPPITGANIQAVLHKEYVTLSMVDGTVLQRPFTLDARLNYEPPGYAGDVNLFLAGEKALNVSGTISGERVQATALVDDLNLAILGAFVPNLPEVSGVMTADLTISGTLKNPQPNGFARVRNFAMDVPGLDMPLRNGIVDIAISPNQVVVDTLFVQSRGGTIRVSGSIENIMAASASGKLTAEIDNLPVRKKDMFDIEIDSARLAYSKTGENYLLAGDVKLGESRVLYDLRIQDAIKRITQPAPPGEGPPPLFSRTRLNITVSAEDNLFIDNNLADMELQAELEVIGTMASPNLIGRIVAIEGGEVTYLDRQFEITEGTLEFTDRTQLNPRLNISAQSSVASFQSFGGQSYEITLSLTGTLQEPSFKMSSNPPLDQPNIISLLTFGVTREQVGIGAAPSDTTAALQDVLKQRAEALASQQIAGYVGGQLENLLDLEQVTIEGNLFNLNGEQGGPRIIAAKQITRDIELIYSTAISDLNDQGFRINYQISNTVSLRGESDSRGRTGFDIMYRLRFR